MPWNGPFFLLLAGVAWLAGCAVGPNYHRPAIDAPAAYRDDRGGTNRPFGEMDWWLVYQDPALQALIREALTNNYDFRIAATRVEQSRAVAMQARSQFFPSVNYDATIGRGRNVIFNSPYPNNGAMANSSVAVLNSFWEVDFWGRVRRLNESARAQYLATEEARRGVLVSLLGDVATAYFRLLELDEELKIARETTNSFSESLRIFSRRAEEGTASGLETSRAEAALDDAAASVPSIRERIAIAENELAILLGRNPGAIDRSAPLLEERTPPEVPPGLPSALLENRPDIRESEQRLRSANALIGESVAEFFPQIGLTALLGKVSPELSAFTLGGANAWGIGASAAGPLFEGGRLVGQYRQNRAARDEAALEYRQTILNAFREVSDALISRERLAEIRLAQAREVQALERSVKLSSERYTAGKASYYEVLEAQQQLFPAQLALVQTERDQLLAIVALYKALGGGWKSEGTSAAGGSH